MISIGIEVIVYILQCIIKLECRKFIPVDVTFGKRIINGNIGVLTDVDFDSCMMECLKRKRCISINYCASMLMCEINYVSSVYCANCLENNPKFITSEKSKFSIMAHRKTVCDPSSCSIGERCVLQPKEQNSCEPSDCDMYTVGHPAYINLSPIGLYSKINILCPVGYISVGNSYVGCTEEGQWTEKLHKCQIVDCGYPPEVQNSIATLTNTTYGENATFTCAERYEDNTMTDDILICRENGRWGTPSIKCEWGGCIDVYNVTFPECITVLWTSGSYINDYTDILANKAGRQSMLVRLGAWCTQNKLWQHSTVTCSDDLVCDDIPNVLNGYYVAYSSSLTSLTYCNTNTLDGTWTVIQRRFRNWWNFDDTWTRYKEGFGYVNGDYWIGNDMIHEMTGSGSFRVAFVMTDQIGDHRYAVYETFIVGAESDDYRLTIGGYSVVNDEAGDSMTSMHNGMKFSTKDVDNDEANSEHCANRYSGGWWWRDCGDANLNGKWGSTVSKEGIFWKSWHGDNYSMSHTMIMIQRKVVR